MESDDEASTALVEWTIMAAKGAILGSAFGIMMLIGYLIVEVGR